MSKQETIPWYSEEAGFFGSDYYKEYADSIAPERTTEEVDFIEQALNLKKGTKILDLACGNGRHTIELAKRGYEMTGQDLNLFFLEHAKKSAEETGINVSWVHGDMRKVPFEDNFDVVLNLCNAFGYLENEEEDRKVLQQVVKVLKTKGIFMIDVINRERIMCVFKEKDCKELSDGSKIITERKFNLITGYNYEQRIRMWSDGRQERLNIVIRIYALTELIAMCKSVGLVFHKAYGDYNREEVRLDSNRNILITKKCDISK